MYVTLRENLYGDGDYLINLRWNLEDICYLKHLNKLCFISRKYVFLANTDYTEIKKILDSNEEYFKFARYLEPYLNIHDKTNNISEMFDKENGENLDLTDSAEIAHEKLVLKFHKFFLFKAELWNLGKRVKFD